MTNSPGNWKLQVDPSVLKSLKKAPQKDRARLLQVLKFLHADPYFGDVQKMEGYLHSWRRRVGHYRIFYTLKPSERVVLVSRVERRTSNTYRRK